MFQLYKQRKFSDLINDTFNFFKVAGKNYFKTYFIINGGVLLILTLLIYLVTNVFFSTLFSSFGSPNSDAVIQEYFSNNLGYFIGVGIAITLLFVLFTLLSYSFPVVYLKLYEKEKEPSTGQILSMLKSRSGKIILFALLSMVTFLPITVIVGTFAILLIFIIIGIPIAIIVFSALTCWISLSFFDYINTNNGYFTSMGNGFRMLMKNFWYYAGVTFIFILIVYVINMIVTLIPTLIGTFTLLSETTVQTSEAPDFSFAQIMSIISLVLSVVVSYFLTNLTLVNQGIIYYTNLEEEGNNSLHSDIDLIGADSE